MTQMQSAPAQTSDHPLQAHTGAFQTSVGGAFPGERAVFHGRDIHADVMHDTTWLELCSQAVGCRLTPAQAKLLDTFMVATSYPDARVWNNRVASLAGSTRSTPGLAFAAANAVSEATVFGRRNEYKAVAFFKRAVAAMQAGATLGECVDEHLATQGVLPGYGRPLYNGDERIPPMMALARELDLHDGPHVQLAFALEEYLHGIGKPLKMNAGALVAAFGADFGFTPRQWTMLLFPSFLAGMQPCFLEALEKPIGAVFAARVDQVDYTGPAPRSWED
ncbi:MAG: hypothetical protein JHD16_04350 [Solirubrobacteraceae bacterium]|nr:hypothetical protein [Solirubrobacteraceae bacterium]